MKFQAINQNATSGDFLTEINKQVNYFLKEKTVIAPQSTD